MDIRTAPADALKVNDVIALDWVDTVEDEDWYDNTQFFKIEKIENLPSGRLNFHLRAHQSGYIIPSVAMHRATTVDILVED